MSRRGGVLALLMVALAASTGVPAALAGTLEDFGEATAQSTFGESIRVEQAANLPEAPTRAEALVRVGGSDRTFLADISTPPAGASTLRYTYDTPFGGVFPNTRVELGFRLTFGYGRTFDTDATNLLYEYDLVDCGWIEG